jgi:methionyl-tRNA synthetase
VWADALVNYITVMGGIEGWEQHPADIHLIAKDIARFHSILWPAMLMSAGLPLPGQVVTHGFLTINNTKISKSLGNVIDPLDMADRYGIDALRYFLLREVPFGEDGDFSEVKMKERYNSDLANGLGNFAARILALAEKEELRSAALDPTFDFEIQKMRQTVFLKTKEFKFHEALAAAWAAIAFGDRYLNNEAVWAIKDEMARRTKLFNLISLLDNVAAVLLPYLPGASRKITAGIQWEGEVLHATRIEPLFPRIV